MNSSAKVWFITGSNSGFGLALTKAVLEKGDRVIATSRHPEELDDGPYRNHEALRKIHPDLMNFEAWLQHSSWKGEEREVQKDAVTGSDS